uniref:Homologous recombination OB-fold protein OB-fold domain-containing protein n=1 Tax=Tanacetum cinerariifolium TaxID=118510 RepID=A0A699H8B9_TANCI|nr:hypothetical protein [Tanacetum cinerariifolium]
MRSSHRSDELWFDVYFDGRFFMCPLKYEDETILDLMLPMSKRLSFKEMNDLLLDKTKEDIWKWFYCKPKCILEEDEYYFKNLDVVFESNKEATSIYRGHEKEKNDASTMSFKEIVAWEKEELKRNFDDVSEDDDFQSSPWVKALEFMNDCEEIGGGCFGDIESYLKKGKLEIVVAIINSCSKNVLGDMNVTLKDPSGTMFGTIHYKVLSSKDGYAKDIKVEYALILRNRASPLYVERKMDRELRRTRILKDLCHEVTDAVKDKAEVIEEVKELGVAAQGSDSMA